MKQFILSVFLTAALLTASSAQKPLYILFDPACMNKLEYQYTYNGQNLLMCSYARDANELYFFLIGNQAEATITANLPKEAVTCQDLPINSNVMNAINAGSKVTYFVFRQQNGYSSVPVKSGGYIIRSGTSFAFRSPNYDFVIDTANIDYARNLSQPGVASPVYLTGRRKNDCLNSFSFRLEPAKKESPRADVDVIPGIGIISDRTGKTGVEMEQNVYRLLKINGMNLDDYIYAYCRIAEKPDSSNASTFITNVSPANAPGTFDPYYFDEPDKETHAAPTGNDKQKLAECPEQPGYGYHIVQPGETFNAIARIYSVNPKSLLEWNNIPNPEKIKVCDKLWLSPQGAGKPAAVQADNNNYHVVQKGETLVGIARKYNLTEARIRRLNNFPPSGTVVIQPGQKILIAEPTGNTGTGGGTGATKPSPISNTQQPSGYVPPVATPGAAGRLVYKTQKGETLNSVAWKFGYTTPYFKHMNKNAIPANVSDDAVIPEGMAFIVSDGKGGRDDFPSYQAPAQTTTPATSGDKNQGISTGAPNTGTSFQPQKPPGYEYIGEYIVKPGDTLQSVAKQYNLSPEKLAAANGMKSNQELTPRSIVKIPK
jgi:LysM repeat protein